MAITFETHKYVVHRCDTNVIFSKEVRADDRGKVYWDGGTRYCDRCGEALPDYISEEARRTMEASYRKWVKW